MLGCPPLQPCCCPVPSLCWPKALQQHQGVSVSSVGGTQGINLLQNAGKRGIWATGWLLNSGKKGVEGVTMLPCEAAASHTGRLSMAGPFTLKRMKGICLYKQTVDKARY